MRWLILAIASLSSLSAATCSPRAGYQKCVTLTQKAAQDGSSASANFPVGVIGTANGTIGTGTAASNPFFASSADLRTVANGGKIQNTIAIGGVLQTSYVSGGSFAGTGTCTLTAFSGVGSGATANIAVSAGVAGAVTMTAPGSGYTTGAQTATLGNGTATCSGTATLSSFLNLTANVMPADLAFTSDSAGTTLLNFETASYTPTTGVIQVFVNLSITNASDTAFYASFGNAGVTTFQGSVLATWNAAFVGVWHIEQNVISAGKITTSFDSTTNDLILTAGGTNPVTAAGIAGLSVSFDGASRLALNSVPPANLFPNGSQTRTLETWWKHSSAFVSLETVAGWGGSSAAALWSHAGCDNGACGTGGNTLLPVNYFSASCFQEPYTNNSNFNYSASTYPTGQTREDQASKYLNGTSVTCTFSSPATTVATVDPHTSGGFNIGGSPGGTNLWGSGDLVDEVRVSNVARSADWILATYNNFNTPGSFVVASDPPVTNMPPAIF